jgi:hypothetical protein
MTAPELTPFRDIVRGDADATIVACEARLRMAQLTGDVAELERLLDDVLLFTGPTGELASKEEDLAAHRSGVVRFREHVPEELRVRPVGQDVVVVSLRARLVVEVSGQLHRGTYRYTRIWVRDERNAWRVVGGHVSGVA